MIFGATLAISCALVWSMAVILFKKISDEVHPIVLNLAKNSLGFVLLIPTALLVEGPPDFLPTLDTGTIIILCASGFIGIGWADAMVLRALTYIGAARIAILECVYSPFVIMLSLVFLGESLNLQRSIGVVLVLLAIIIVSTNKEQLKRSAPFRPTSPSASPANRGQVLTGVLWGVAGLFSMAGGIVAIKPIFAEVPLFWLIEIRMAAGVVSSLMIAWLLPNRKEQITALLRTKHPITVLTACFLSTYVAMILWVAGYKYNDASIAAVLNQTSTIFTVVFAAIFLKERITFKVVACAAVAASGVVLIAMY